MTEPGPLLLHLDRGSRVSLHRQLYDELRQAILAGRLKPGTRIAASRRMAAELELSRTTVLTAVQRLVSEGLLETRVGAGTWVSPSMRGRLAGHRPDDRGVFQAPPDPNPLSRRARRLVELARAVPEPSERPLPLQVGLPALDVFPSAKWARIEGRHWRAAKPRDLAYGSRMGYDRLREAIAEQMSVSRGTAGGADRVLVTSGSQVGLALAALVLLDPGDVAWVEEPGYGGARGAFISADAQVVPVPVDDEGLDVAAGVRRAPEARLVQVTPSHQFPIGSTMSLERRLALLRWAEIQGAWVLEDDYDSEYRFESRPLMSLQGLDEGRRVLYLGTFSKTLFPSVRLGFLILPESLVDAFASARYYLDHHPPIPHQAAMADFIAGGHFARHVHRMRGLYRERRDALVEAMGSYLSGLLELAPASTGLHVTAFFREDVNDREVEAAARRAGLGILALSSFYAGESGRSGIVVGLGSTPANRIRQAVVQLAEVMEGVIGDSRHRS